MQDLDDELHHDDDESAGSETLKLTRLIAVNWATSQSLKLGDHDFQPAILLEIAAGETSSFLHPRDQSWSVCLAPPFMVADYVSWNV